MSGAQEFDLRPVWWDDDGLSYVDGRALPGALVRVAATSVASVLAAIETSAVSSPRCIDLLAAFGVVLAQRQTGPPHDLSASLERLSTVAMTDARGCDAFSRVITAVPEDRLTRAQTAVDDRRRIDRAIAKHAGYLLPSSGKLITHGDTGAFSTGGFGTAVAAIIAGHRSGKRLHAFVSESRPRLGGRRFAAFELAAAGVPCSVFVDAAAAAIMRSRTICTVIVGADAVAANGDIRATIGTYGLALAAAQHGVPFYVCTPRVLLDASVRDGTAFSLGPDQIGEVAAGSAEQDLTPGRLITAFITEYGPIKPPYDESLAILSSRPMFEMVDREDIRSFAR